MLLKYNGISHDTRKKRVLAVTKTSPIRFSFQRKIMFKHYLDKSVTVKTVNLLSTLSF